MMQLVKALKKEGDPCGYSRNIQKRNLSSLKKSFIDFPKFFQTILYDSSRFFSYFATFFGFKQIRVYEM